METNLTKKLEKVLEKEKARLEKEETLEKFEKAAEEFEEMIKKGLVKRRGYNLMTIDNKHLNGCTFNSNLQG